MQRLCNDTESFQDNEILNGGACEGVLFYGTENVAFSIT